MAEMSSQEQEQVKQLKRVLEGWRMAIVPIKSVMLWEQQWHPAAIFGAVSFLHLLFWVLDLNFLTTVAVVGLIVNLVDFIVPIVCHSMYSSSSWTGQQEKMFEDTCKSLVMSYNRVLGHFRTYYSLRETSPYMYYVISISMLLVLTWISTSINNIFLLYILFTAALLTPGLQHQGLLNTLLCMVNLGPKTVKADKTTIVGDDELVTDSVIPDTGDKCRRHYKFTDEGCVITLTHDKASKPGKRYYRRL